MLQGRPTIADIVNMLSDPLPYARGVLGNMVLAKREHGGAWVRIGTTKFYERALNMVLSK